MDRKIFDTFIIGHISLDEIVYEGKLTKGFGGAVVYSSYSALAGGNKVGVFTKASEEDKDEILNIFNTPEDDLYYILSSNRTSIRNEYLTADKEKRICTALSVADPFKIEEVPDVDSKIYHLAGLIFGDYDKNMIKPLSEKGMVAVDVQGYLRRNIDGEMTFKDWEEKKEFLPYIHFLKTDAAEAEIMTGEKDRRKAAEILHSWGAKEVMITYNTEVLVYDGKNHHTAPLKPRNLSGRTGRGDTCFSAYITERLKNSLAKSLKYAAALVSLKMETSGPFKGTRKDVEDYIREFYDNTIN